jgi:DNA-binding CsgD family transcriptional regulator
MVRCPPWTLNCEAYLIRRKKLTLPLRARTNDLCVRPESFVICERSSGAIRFRVDAEPGGRMPVDQMAGLVAMHCLVRGQAPADFEVLVVARDQLLQEVAVRAEKLLAAGRAIGAGVKISPREQQVLEGVIQNLGNKEIASRLHVAERTVKFHVSSLLAKYGVSDRVALCREVLLARAPAGVTMSQPAPQTLFGYPIRIRENHVENVNTPDPSNSAAEVPQSRGRALALVTRQRFAT